MKIFVTGIAGFLGSHVAEEFVNDGHEVVGCDNLLGGYTDNIPTGAEFYNVDLLSRTGLSELMKDCDLVYHTACTAYEGLSVFSPSLIVENTTQISVNTMVAAIQAGVKRFIHCSSMARYGNLGEVKYTEDMACRPQDPYGIAKLAAENLLNNLADIHGIELVITVPHNIIGPRQKYDDPYRNVASIMANLMLQGREPVIYGDGEQQRCFSDIRDVMQTLKAVAYEDKAVGEVYNIGPDEQPVSINQLCNELGTIIGMKPKPIYMPGRPQEVKHAVCSSDKIRRELGYETKCDLRRSLESIVEYVRNRGVKPFEYHLELEIINEKVPATWKDRLF